MTDSLGMVKTRVSASNDTLKVNTGKGAADFFAVGATVSGTVTKVEGEKVSISFDRNSEKREFGFERTSFSSAYVGEKKSFEVSRDSSGKIQLTELGKARGDGKVSFTGVEARTSALIQTFGEMSEGFEEDGSMQGVHERMSEDDAAGICDAGLSVKEYLAGQLEDALDRIKLDRVINEHFLEKEKLRLDMDQENVKQMSGNHAGRSNREKVVEDRLRSADLPVSEELIAEICAAADMTSDITGLSDGGKAYLIDNELEGSINNIYKASFVKTVMRKPVSEKVWESLRNQAQKTVDEAVGILAETGEKVPDEEDARWLVETELPVTVDALVMKCRLDALELSEDKVLADIIEGVNLGRRPADAIILPIREKAEPERVTPGYAEKLLHEAELSDADFNEGQGIAGVTVRRRMEEARLIALSQGRVKSDELNGRENTDELIASVEKSVNNLKKIEDAYYSRCFDEVGKPVEPGDVEKLSEIIGRFEEVKASPAYVLGETFAIRHTISVEELADSGSRLQAVLERAEERYETVGTAVRQDLGDSLAKAFASVDGLIEELGFEVTEANRRAVRILGYNRIEITEENINSIKNYDRKVNDLLETMTPVRAAELVKKGIDPLNVPIEELTAQIRELKITDDRYSNERFSEYLVRLDRKGALTAEERQAYIGIYRLLNRITKDGGAVIGDCYARKVGLTLGNLLGADRTRRAGHIEVGVDDSFGGLTDVIEHGVSISEQILSCIDPAKMSFPDFLDNSLEGFLENMAASEQYAEYNESARQLMEDVSFAANADAETEFLQGFSEPATLGSILAVRELESNPLIFDKLAAAGVKIKGIDLDREALERSSDAFPESEEELSEYYEGLTDREDKSVSQQYENESITSASALALNRIGTHISLLKALSEKQYYELPIDTENGTIQMNLTIVHSEAERGTIKLKLRTEEPVEAELKVNGNSIEGFFRVEGRPMSEHLKGILPEIERTLLAGGFSSAVLYSAETELDERRYLSELAHMKTAGGRAGRKETQTGSGTLVRAAGLVARKLVTGLGLK